MPRPPLVARHLESASACRIALAAEAAWVLLWQVEARFGFNHSDCTYLASATTTTKREREGGLTGERADSTSSWASPTSVMSRLWLNSHLAPKAQLKKQRSSESSTGSTDSFPSCNANQSTCNRGEHNGRHPVGNHMGSSHVILSSPGAKSRAHKSNSLPHKSSKPIDMTV